VEEKKTAGAKSKILIEDVNTEAPKVAPAPEDVEPKKAKAEPAKPVPEPVKLVDKVQEIPKEENVVQKAEEVKAVDGAIFSHVVICLSVLVSIVLSV
jgi:hypothetical protein